LAETTGGSLSLLEEPAPGLTPRSLQGSCRQRTAAAHVEQLNGEHRETERDRWIRHVVPASAQAVPGAATVARVEADEARGGQEPELLELKPANRPATRHLAKALGRSRDVVPGEPGNDTEGRDESCNGVQISAVPRLSQPRLHPALHLAPLPQEEERPRGDRARRPQLPHQ